jgi:hypothetical protein
MLGEEFRSLGLPALKASLRDGKGYHGIQGLNTCPQVQILWRLSAGSKWNFQGQLYLPESFDGQLFSYHFPPFLSHKR